MGRETDIILIDDNEKRHQRTAPDNFNWTKYPDGIHVQGSLYVYVGTASIY